MNTGILDIESIKQIMGDDKESLSSFFELFKEQTEIEIADMEKFLEVHNWEKVSQIAHKLKSTYGNIGSTSAYNILSEMEEDCKNDPDFEKILEQKKNFVFIQKKILELMDMYISS